MTRVDFADASHNYFAYDADSKRVEKWEGEGYTRFIYQGPDMLKLLQERDDSEATVAQYTMGNGLEAMRRDAGSGIADGDSSFYHFDWLGNTFALTDADEAVTDTYIYNAWGETLDRTGTTENPHAYVGKLRYYWNAEPVLYLLGFRYLDAASGRFWSVDPVRDGGNWYGYVGNAPALTTDPVGLLRKPCVVRNFSVTRVGLWGCTNTDVHETESTDEDGPPCYALRCRALLRITAEVCPPTNGCIYSQQRRGVSKVGGKNVQDTHGKWEGDYYGPLPREHTIPRHCPQEVKFESSRGAAPNGWTRVTFWDCPGTNTAGRGKKGVCLLPHLFPVEFDWSYRGYLGPVAGLGGPADSKYGPPVPFHWRATVDPCEIVVY